MNLKNKVKLILIKENKLLKYNDLFALKQTRFLLTKIIEILNPNANAKECARLEKQLVENKADMFFEGVKEITTIAKDDTYASADWKSLGKYLYFVFQTGVFYKNKKKGVDNIFISGNYIELNIEKKMLFNKFVESIKPLNPEHNIFIKALLKVVL